MAFQPLEGPDKFKFLKHELEFLKRMEILRGEFLSLLPAPVFNKVQDLDIIKELDYFFTMYTFYDILIDRTLDPIIDKELDRTYDELIKFQLQGVGSLIEWGSEKWRLFLQWADDLLKERAISFRKIKDSTYDFLKIDLDEDDIPTPLSYIRETNVFQHTFRMFYNIIEGRSLFTQQDMIGIVNFLGHIIPARVLLFFLLIFNADKGLFEDIITTIAVDRDPALYLSNSDTVFPANLYSHSPSLEMYEMDGFDYKTEEKLNIDNFEFNGDTLIKTSINNFTLNAEFPTLNSTY